MNSFSKFFSRTIFLGTSLILIFSFIFLPLQSDAASPPQLKQQTNFETQSSQIKTSELQSETPTDIIVKLKDDADTEHVLDTTNVTQTDVIDEDQGLLVVQLESTSTSLTSASLSNTIKELNNNPDVEYAEPNYKRQITAINTNDTYKDLLWAIYNNGQTVNGVNGVVDADMDIDDAWNITEGTSSVIVAVVDSGVDYTHPDLAANMWDGSSCKDENGTTIVGGCLHGYDYENNDNNPQATNFHGTHVAGTIAAVKNNGAGVIGVAPKTKIMAIRFGLDVASEIKSINFAIQNGAKVINASFSGTGFSSAEYNAIQAFQNAGGIFVAAASNEGTDDDVTPHYPASYDLSNIISVAATDQSDTLASFSNFGHVSVDVGAPGVNIASTLGSSTYGYNSGTSMASPQVAGLVALTMAAYPTLSPADIKSLILNTGDPESALQNITVTGKRVNAYNAVTGLTPHIGYAENDLIATSGISHAIDGSGIQTFSFFVKEGLLGITATTTQVEYSLNNGATWTIATTGSAFNFNTNNFSSVISYAGTPYTLTWNTRLTASTSATTTAVANIRFKTTTSATTSPYVYSVPFTIDTLAPTLQIDSGLSTTTTEQAYTISGTSESGVTIDVVRNNVLQSQYVVPQGTSTFSISAAIDTSTDNVFSLVASDSFGNRSGTSTLPTVTYTGVSQVVSSGGGGGSSHTRSSSGGGGSSNSKTSVISTSIITKATSTINATTTVTSTTIFPTQTQISNDAGCLPGYLFSSTTGIKCSASTASTSSTTTLINYPRTFPVVPTSIPILTRDLTMGSIGEDVKALQTYLNAHGFIISSSGAGSIGQETILFGGLTRAALASFQQAHGIIPSAGYLGPLTRAIISQTP